MNTWRYSLIFTTAAILSLPLSAEELRSFPQLEQVLPSTSDDVNLFLESVQDYVEDAIDDLLSLPEEERTLQNFLKSWNELTSNLISKFSILLHIAQSEYPTTLDATIALAELQSFMYSAILQNYELYYTIIGFIEQGLHSENGPSSYENHMIECILSSCKQLKDTLPQEEQDRLAELQVLCEMQKKTPFLYLKGDVEEKKASDDPLSVLTINTCMLPGHLSLLWGGVAPWQERVSALADKIIETNADVVCLQEMFVEEGTMALFEKLKDHYTHFYTLIAPLPLGFTFEMNGFPSGLFVASKYPIANPQFTPYSVAGYPAKWGVFDFTVAGADKALAHIYNTHLQSFDYMQFPKIRGIQLKEIMDVMEIDYQAQGNDIPYLLCGDLNIPLGSQEPGFALIQSYFYDAYNFEPKEINDENRTCTDFFSRYFTSNGKTEGIDPNFQILDYALLLHTLPSLQGNALSEGFSIETTLVPMNDLSKPEEAVSDHHGLLTKIYPIK